MQNTAMILGIIGGILGMVFSAIVIIVGVVMRYASTMIPEDVEIPMNFQRLLPMFGDIAIWRGIGALIFSIIGLIAAIIIMKRNQVGGIFLLIAGIAGFVFLLIGFVVPGILLIIAGILAIVSKEKTPDLQHPQE